MNLSHLEARENKQIESKTYKCYWWFKKKKNHQGDRIHSHVNVMKKKWQDRPIILTTQCTTSSTICMLHNSSVSRIFHLHVCFNT